MDPLSLGKPWSLGTVNDRLSFGFPGMAGLHEYRIVFAAKTRLLQQRLYPCTAAHLLSLGGQRQTI